MWLFGIILSFALVSALIVPNSIARQDAREMAGIAGITGGNEPLGRAYMKVTAMFVALSIEARRWRPGEELV